MIVDRCVTSYGAVNVTDADRATAWRRGIPLGRACEERVAQDYANRSLQIYSDYYKFDYPVREMTAEDLGLPTKRYPFPDYPFAFWLGAYDPPASGYSAGYSG